MAELKLGRHQHFKGKIVDVIGMARHSETLEEFVVYREIGKNEKWGENPLWVRPKKMFLEIVEKDGKKVPRFKFIEE